MGKKLGRIIKQRRNFLPAFVVTGIFWVLWGWLVFSFPPEAEFALFAFYLLLFAASFLTFALLFANSKLGFLTATFIIAILLFRYYQIGNILNLSLLGAIYLALFIYLK